MEKIFETSLNRLQKIYNITGDKNFKKEPTHYKERLRNIEVRCEKIIAEMFYKRVVEKNAIKYIRNNYIDMDKSNDSKCVLSFDNYGFCEEFWKESYILVGKEFFDDLFNKTKQKEIKNIENKSLKLF